MGKKRKRKREKTREWQFDIKDDNSDSNIGGSQNNNGACKENDYYDENERCTEKHILSI